jgi:hypothetical protein
MEPSARRTCNAAAHQCVHDNPASSGALLPKAVPRLCIRCAQGVLDSLARHRCPSFIHSFIRSFVHPA